MYKRQVARRALPPLAAGTPPGPPRGLTELRDARVIRGEDAERWGDLMRTSLLALLSTSAPAREAGVFLLSELARHVQSGGAEEGSPAREALAPAAVAQGVEEELRDAEGQPVAEGERDSEGVAQGEGEALGEAMVDALRKALGEKEGEEETNSEPVCKLSLIHI